MQKQIGDFINRLTLSQKILIAGVTISVALGMVLLLSLTGTTEDGVLYSNLNPQDAAQVVEKLRERKVPYRIDDGGSTILVPHDQVYELRLTFASEGLPQASVIGYEIFDRSNLGISDFVQKVHYRRAIEGELARTILQLEEVEGARVHIVVPERTLFREDQKPATASVVIKLRPNTQLGVQSIKSIMHLVASSIEGLKAENVTIVDSRGDLLSDQTKRDTFAQMTSTQYEVQRNVEEYLRNKAQSLLEGIVGKGNAIVQVNAELDFRQIERTLEMFDADNPAIRSEQLTEERNVMNTDTPPSTLTSSVTNYEINRTLERIVENAGGIQRLSVAAIVNGRRETVERDGQQVTEYMPRNQNEMDQLTEVVARAVGYNPVRNDEISVVNLPFGHEMEERDLIYEQDLPGTWQDLLEKILIILAMLGALYVAWSLLNKLSREEKTIEEEIYTNVLEPDQSPRELLRRKITEFPAPDEDIDEDALLRGEKKKRISEYISRNPEEASRLLKIWLQED